MRVARLINLIPAFVLTVLVGTAMAADPAQPVAKLTSADCVKCHEAPPRDIAANGGKHKTEVTCQDCHQGHPPKVKHPIPQCNMCHTDKPHFKLQGCLGCHTNPHTPKIIKFGNNVTDPCLTCHTQQIQQLRANPSKHTALACSFCHNVHGFKPACTKCHNSHSADITAKDCSACHKAHQPKNVTYKSDIPPKYCAACHKRAYTLLSASPFKHSKLSCAYCHKDKHKTVPQCTQCHGKPHAAAIHAKFTKCGDCHNIAHDLNHFVQDAEAKKAAAAPAAPAAPAEKAPAKAVKHKKK
ncbi:cytochrome C [Geomonas sp. Red32]|uniref:cytochrome C n=1 Tax=Geomonas sp. Red32 TaxID=2912856 RepID=UPI00202CBD0C|nr:cytochrome C [Geomonas sp. Red32]MCM0080116.1 cytochrome C [Geomonas sp. Red32]